MKKITYKNPYKVDRAQRSIHEIMDEFMEHVDRVKAHTQRRQMEFVLGTTAEGIEWRSENGLRVRHNDMFGMNIEDWKSLRDQEIDPVWSVPFEMKKFGFTVELPSLRAYQDYIPDPNTNQWSMPPATNKQQSTSLKLMEIEGRTIINKASVERVARHISPQTMAAYTTTKDEISFNGAPIEDVISYDEAGGEVHYYERHWSSKELIPDTDDSTGYRTGRAKGQVRVVKKADATLASPDYTQSPGCGIDPSYAPWYPYGTPGFRETAQRVEFELVGFGQIAPDDIPNAKTCLGSVWKDLMVDGAGTGYNWTLVSACEHTSDLILTFVLLVDRTKIVSNHYACADQHTASFLGSYSGQSLSHLNVVSGYPHIYKIVKIARGNFSVIAPAVSPPCTIDDPKSWLQSSKVVILAGNPQYYSGVDPVTLKVMQKLC